MTLYQKKLESISNQNACFVVIGAMDGVTHDELFPYAKANTHWCGVLVEPVEFYFEKLKVNYENRENLHFVKKAVTNKKEIRSLNIVDRKAIDEGAVPSWCDGISTFNPEGPTIAAEGIANFVYQQDVGCVPFIDIWEIIGFKNIDILQIDAEGSDYSIFCQAWSLGVRPLILHIEIVQMNQDEIEDVTEILLASRYEVEIFGDNLTAFKKPIMHSIRRKQIAFFTYSQWAFGSIFSSLEKELYKFGYDAHILDWKENDIVQEIELLSRNFDLIITNPGKPIDTLIQNNVELSKIVAIAHGISDIRESIDCKNDINSLAGFSCVSTGLRDYCSDVGIIRQPLITRNGIQFDRFYDEPSNSLRSIGYAGALNHVVQGNEKDCKRVDIAKAVSKYTQIPMVSAFRRHYLSMPDFYRNIDCVIVSSDENEACGLPLMEAAAAGRLPVSAKIGILKEFVNPPGLIVPLDADEFIAHAVNDLIGLTEDDKAFHNLCVEAQQFAFDHYDWKNVIGLWLELFDSSL